MALDGGQVEQRGPQSVGVTTSDLIERLSSFEGPPEQFLVNLLAAQCQVASAAGGAILRPGPGGRMEIMALFPPQPQGSTAPAWLAHAVEMGKEVMTPGVTTTRALHDPDAMYGQRATRHLVMIPLKGQRGVRGLATFVVETPREQALAASVGRLELTISLLSLYEMRQTLQRRELDIRRLQLAMEVTAAVNEHDRFMGAAMAFCNELASRWQCDRVSVGFLKGRYVRLKAMSHTEKFSRKMKVVQDLEAAMEECLDQDVEVGFPAGPDATFVSRSAGQLSRRHGPASVLSLPLRTGGEPKAVVTCERAADRAMGLEEIESMRLGCDLSAARLANLHEHDRWFGARMAEAVRKVPAAVVGPKHTWIKVAVVAVFAVAAFLVFAKGDYQADGSFVLQATQRQVVPAPFDGELKQVHVEVNAEVTKDVTVLAELDDSELRVQLIGAQADRASYLTQAAAARRDGKISDAHIAEAEADKIQAQIDLVNYRIKQARLVAAMSGTVISGDWKQRIGAQVETGDVLFEIAPLRPLRAELSIPESEIAEVNLGDEGRLRALGKPGEPVGFVVERISPVAQAAKDKNVFKVRVRLDEIRPWMKLDMSGDAKIMLGRERYAWLWTRKLVNWVRMKLWW